VREGAQFGSHTLPAMYSIEELPFPSEQDLCELGALLVDSVSSGASVNFIAVPSLDAATQWWREALVNPANVLVVARDSTRRIVGCARLMPAPELNGHHRAEIGKLLVHRDVRGQGVATSVMERIEQLAASLDRTLLLLDTETGSYAESFYRSRGWVEFGQVPDHTYDQRGVLSGTTFFMKRLTWI
jgi:GNAT superfamily N-acetyltransferase